jgi:DNA-binding transcriptional ArsR family regulator
VATSSRVSRPERRRPADEDRLDLLFGALSDRTRRAMLARLAAGSACVTELAEPHAMSLPAVSRHLKVLEGAGLVSRAVEGRVHRLEANAEALEDVEQWLEHYRAFWEGQLDALAEFAAAAQRTPRTSGPK